MSFVRHVDMYNTMHKWNNSQSFFPPRGGGLDWKTRLFLPDLHIEVITSWEEQKETWKSLAMEIKIYVLMKSSTELPCLDLS